MRHKKRVHYDIAVMTKLRYPMLDREWGDSDVDDLVREDVWDARREYANALTDAYNDLMTNSYLAAEADGYDPGPPPSVVAIELEKVSGQMQALEEYRDRLIVFARTLASQPVAARALASRTGLSHSTIVRMATEEAVADIGGDVGPAAAEAMRTLIRGTTRSSTVACCTPPPFARTISDDPDQRCQEGAPQHRGRDGRRRCRHRAAQTTAVTADG